MLLLCSENTLRHPCFTSYSTYAARVAGAGDLTRYAILPSEHSARGNYCILLTCVRVKRRESPSLAGLGQARRG